jgi:ribonuclease-3
MPAPAAELAERLGLRFGDPALLEQALVHSSYTNEHSELGMGSNERLEFLGDAVVSLIVSEALWSRHPDEPEGLLTTRRAAIVSAPGLARLATAIGLGEHLLVGQGAERSGERARASVLAGAFEAVCGAIYVDLGLDSARTWLLGIIGPAIEAEAVASLKAPKSRLQEYCFASAGRPPAYRVVSAEGPDHARNYVVEVRFQGELLGSGQGPNRREAETEAARVALAVLGLA